MGYSSGRRYGRARTKQRKRLESFPKVFWFEDVWTRRSVRTRQYVGYLMCIAKDTGLATVRFRNGRERTVWAEYLHYVKEDEDE